ncbi:hypothetical protein GEMRC1_008271 [Eukaryota sp. GEM-RC1]
MSDLSIDLEFDTSVLHVVNGSTLEIIGPPHQSMTITLSYLSQSTTIDLVSNDCHFPKLNSRHGCLCPKGMEFNSLGECVECSLNYYSHFEFNSECRSCPFPRITLQKGSSDLDHCVCPLNTLDSIDSCLPCPHLAECGYGNLTAIEPGFRLNTDTWELDECNFWFNCHQNSCRSRHAYGDLCQYCTEDAVFSKIYCFGMENTWLKVLSFLCFTSILFVADRLVIRLSIVESKFKYIRLAASSLSTFGQKRLLEQFSNYFNILNIIFFVLPPIFFRRASIWVIFIEFLSSIFHFDSSRMLFVVFMVSMCGLSKIVLSRFFKICNFNVRHSAFLLGAVLFSINFLFGTSLFFLNHEGPSFWQTVFLSFHLSFVIYVLIVQRHSPYFLSLICYFVILFASLFESLMYFIIQNLMLVLLISFSTTTIEVILYGISLLFSMPFTFSFLKL